jgi:hypothetical protein
VFTVYIPKGIHIVGSQLGQIPLLKNNDFNLGDRKNYAMLVPHHYLTKTNGKKPHLISQPWIKRLAQYAMLNVMKIPYILATTKRLTLALKTPPVMLSWRILVA